LNVTARKILFSFSLLHPSEMPKGKMAMGKKVAPALAVMKKQEAKKVANPLFEKRPKNAGIRQDIQPKRDFTHFITSPTTSGCSGKGLFSINA
uniref:Uncharacterized protein n=1 Tax=Panthera leo TaxID=9689 RepID=A0A8C9D7Y0_PANLE